MTRPFSALFGPMPPVLAAVRGAVLTAAAAVVLSLLVANRYRASAAFYLDTKQVSSGVGDLASLASQVGLLPPGSTGVSPYLVSELASSDTVLTAVAATPIPDSAFRRDHPTGNLERHYGTNDRSPEKRFQKTVEKLRKRVSTNVSSRSGLVRITLTDTDPGVAAWLARAVLDRVQHSIGVARASRARAERIFLETRTAAAQDSVRAAETALAAFLTSNRQTSQSPILQMRESQLRRRAELMLTLFSAMQRDLERARADEIRDTPVLTVIATPVPPIRKSAPIRWLVAAIAFALAFAVHLSWPHWAPAVRTVGIAFRPEQAPAEKRGPALSAPR
jgi:uncharacterized protein involved in exopolysaccharide biosynthesis